MVLFEGHVLRCVTVSLYHTDTVEEQVLVLLRFTLHWIQSIPDSKICKPTFTLKMYAELIVHEQCQKPGLLLCFLGVIMVLWLFRKIILGHKCQSTEGKVL